jgi:hypothetical protein
MKLDCAFYFAPSRYGGSEYDIQEVMVIPYPMYGGYPLHIYTVVCTLTQTNDQNVNYNSALFDALLITKCL